MKYGFFVFDIKVYLLFTVPFASFSLTTLLLSLSALCPQLSCLHSWAFLCSSGTSLSCKGAFGFPLLRSRFPISGVSFILGNDLAGGKVFPPPEVVDVPVVAVPESAVSVPNVFPVCAVTRAQARKLGETVDLSDSFFAIQNESEHACCTSQH